MSRLDQVNTEKKSILQKISEIESMRKGSVNEQTIRTRQKDGSIKENGPYYILTAKDTTGKTITEAIPADKLEFFHQEIKNYKEFKNLTHQYEMLSEESSKLKFDNDTLTVNAEKKTKNKRSKSSGSLN
ncbi:MAG: hypothetical protein FWG14_12970 [Peptococcaceae bacterium]|nr:hypothetical protein [Peptococcaceae bacterium]